MNYTFDQFAVVKIKISSVTTYKVFATRHSEWRLNSGIVKWNESDGVVSFYGYSGSCYSIGVRGADQCNPYCQYILNKIGALKECEIISFDQFKKEFEGID